jgi:putative FmdB family regulatory protein
MPMYEYECGSCGRRFEQLQRITEDALATDPECGGPVHRVIQPVGIIFKGSGFYVNDSRKTNSSSSASSSYDGSKAETKSETKSESKSDSKGDSSSSPSSSSGDSKPAAAAAS